MKKAFTLIELLVVIAIIAILAAILFPVFAQAKQAAKKTAAISNAKQIALSTIMYSGDNDDLFPFTIPPNSAAKTWRQGSLLDTPSDWRPGIGGSGYPDRAMLFANSVQPYQKNYNLFSIDGAKENFFGQSETGKLKDPTHNTFVMNGFLQNYSNTAVTDVSTTPMYWNGFGNVKMKGFSMSNPQMICPASTDSPCHYSSSSSYTWYLNDTVTPAPVFGKSTIIARVDGSVKAKNIAAVTDGTTNVNSAPYYANEPWAIYNSSMVPQQMTGCDFTGQGKYMACYFRPDAEGRKP